MFKLVISFVVFILLKNSYDNKRFISSTTVFSACYFLIFVLFPLNNTTEIIRHGELIDVLAAVGIVAFYLGQKCVKDTSNHIVNPQYVRIVGFKKAFWVYLFVFIISTFLFIRQVGISRIVLILSGSMTGKELNLGEDISTTSYGYFTDLLIPLTMILCVTAKKKKEIVFSYIALFAYVTFTIVFGFTRIFTISILAMFVVYKIRYLPQKKQLMYSLYGASLLLILLVCMNFIRCMGVGGELDMSQIFNIEYILESSDFGYSYIWLDRLLDINPPYIRFDTYFKPIFYVFIPRSIWPNKPEQTSMQILKILDPALASTGYSTAGYSVIGEGYAMIGYVGVFLFPFIWGLLCGKFDIKYYRRLKSGYSNCIQNLYYYFFAVFVVISGQRGDWNQYMIIVIWFYMLPIYMLSKKYHIMQKREQEKTDSLASNVNHVLVNRNIIKYNRKSVIYDTISFIKGRDHASWRGDQ